MALTKAQREFVLERDGHTSQMRTYSEEKGWHLHEGLCGRGQIDHCQRLHVHHILPQRKAQSMGLSREEYDQPYNLISTFECLHTGRCQEGRIK